MKLDDDSAAERDWWTAVLAPASCHPARSKERTAAVRAIVAAEHIRDGERVRVDEGRLWELMAKLGGTVATRGLDEHGYSRVTAALGGVTPEPPPSVEGDPGMMTQDQANLVWRLWLEARRGQDASWGKLDLAIRLLFGLSGGVDTLTLTGARALIDRLAASGREILDLRDVRPIEPAGMAQGLWH